jgi:Fe-S-cluster containining protein
VSISAVRCLSRHASYRCGRSGACCTADWPIPIEADRLNAVRAALASARLATTGGVGALARAPDAESGAALHAAEDGACVFYDPSARGCRIHAALGHDALPLACRQFPRVSVRDPRGVSVTLSHYCPTACALLDRDTPLAIVSSPAFPDDGEYVGLDATTSLPPLLGPALLMDWHAWWEWERLSVARIDVWRGDTAGLLHSLDRAVEHAASWRPGEGDLTSRVRAAFTDPAGAPPPRGPDARALVAQVLAAIPADLRPAALPRGARPSERAMRGFLAAHAFANWTAHLGRGLRSWLRSLELAAALVDAGCGLREADLLLRHLADPYALARSA